VGKKAKDKKQKTKSKRQKTIGKRQKAKQNLFVKVEVE
jgi:hypothetical protein